MCAIPGGSVGASPQSGIRAAGSWLLTPAIQNMKVQPEMLLKTKEGWKRRHRKLGTVNRKSRVILTPDSFLLTPPLQKLTCQDGLPVA
jgi:hypothetical protein